MMSGLTKSSAHQAACGSSGRWAAIECIVTEIPNATAYARHSMIQKSVQRFSKKIMLKQ
jgi:hypothetical protein